MLHWFTVNTYPAAVAWYPGTIYLTMVRFDVWFGRNMIL